ncbi:class I SAM-dependent methyltransferase [Thalassobacillus sp. CUG 92003]|uniref:class I SAM-dependent DNA methyltransferase n=1 Tax=Thalassobacillus sp. CUG 92003 TaxID=2736641 RepID=UPI0015E706DB|nr:class I SAM-dependent methyltransferase [Thalassobacillus sp. CUG 92003]
MGVEFVDLFDQWASSYDNTVNGGDPEYKEVFKHYEDMLGELADISVSPVLEFGVGTANLTRKMVRQGKVVIGIEPSLEMRKIAKIKCPEAAIYEGDFIEYPSLQVPVRSVVSSFAFHHLTHEEKVQAIRDYEALLEPGGGIIMIDTVFQDKDHRRQLIEAAEQDGFLNLAQDLKEEHYAYMDELKQAFKAVNMDVTFTQKNKYAWLIQAKKGA